MSTQQADTETKYCSKLKNSFKLHSSDLMVYLHLEICSILIV